MGRSRNPCQKAFASRSATAAARRRRASVVPTSAQAQEGATIGSLASTWSATSRAAASLPSSRMKSFTMTLESSVRSSATPQALLPHLADERRARWLLPGAGPDLSAELADALERGERASPSCLALDRDDDQVVERLVRR